MLAPVNIHEGVGIYAEHEVDGEIYFMQFRIDRIYEEDGVELIDATHIKPDGEELQEQTSELQKLLNMFLSCEYIEISKDSDGNEFDFAEYTDDGKKIIHEENE